MSNNEQNEVARLLNQGREINEEKDKIIRTVIDDKMRRDQETSFFRGENLLTYTDVSLSQFIGHRAKPDWKKDYQYNVFDPITRDKVMAIISKTGGFYEAQFFNTNKRLAKISETITTVLSGFYTDSTRRLKEKEKNKLSMLAALITPKAIWYEGWRYQKRTIREIEERDETGKIIKTSKKEISHYNGPYGELIPVQDFITGSLRERDMQEQPRVTWIPKTSMEKFRRLYPTSKYPEASKVRPYNVLVSNELTEFIVRNDLKEDEVEIIKYYDKWNDKFVLIANGVMLNAIDSPIPFAHKEYPFVWGGFEEINPWFIYDMPLPMKILDMQDVNNEVLNLTLDLVWRALNEVVLVKNGDEINDDELYGGGMIPVDDPSNFNKMEFGSSFGFQAGSSIMDRVRRSIESSSVDAVASGQSGSRPSVTAREVLAAREAAFEIASLFLQNMENMERNKAELRVKNQLDRYHRPIEWERRIGENLAEQAIPIFRELSVRDTRLDGGKRGTLHVNITESPRTAEELNKENIVNKKEMSQTIDVSPDVIREITFDVEIVANSSQKKSKSQQVAEARGLLSDAAALPQTLNVDYAAKKYVKALGFNEDDAMAKKQEQPQPQGAPNQSVKSPIEGGNEDIASILGGL
jgi:hypothetical protein